MGWERDSLCEDCGMVCGLWLFDIPKCRFVDHLDAMLRGLLVNHVVMRNRKTMV